MDGSGGYDYQILKKFTAKIIECGAQAQGDVGKLQDKILFDETLTEAELSVIYAECTVFFDDDGNFTPKSVHTNDDVSLFSFLSNICFLHAICSTTASLHSHSILILACVIDAFYVQQNPIMYDLACTI